MIPSVFRTNRASISRAELEKHRGLWVAFSPDGAKIIANGETLGEVNQRVKAAGADPNEAVYEHVPGQEDDICLGGEEYQLCSSFPISTKP